MNCEKNAVICEGYLDKRLWRSGKERGEEGTSIELGPLSPMQSLMASTAQRRRLSLPNITLAPIIHGLETSGDRIFFEHYCFRLSAVLTVEGPKKNAFKDILLPLAVKHLGLMHSVLALSSTNIEYDEPYGQALLAKHPDVSVESLKERAQYHWDEAWKDMDIAMQQEKQGIISPNAPSVRYGQMLCLVVRSIAEGKANGEHRIHLQAYKQLVRENPPEDTPFADLSKSISNSTSAWTTLSPYPKVISNSVPSAMTGVYQPLSNRKLSVSLAFKMVYSSSCPRSPAFVTLSAEHGTGN